MTRLPNPQKINLAATRIELSLHVIAARLDLASIKGDTASRFRVRRNIEPVGEDGSGERDAVSSICTQPAHHMIASLGKLGRAKNPPAWNRYLHRPYARDIGAKPRNVGAQRGRPVKQK